MEERVRGNSDGYGDGGIGIEDMKEIQLDQEMSKSDNVHKKSRASFGGGIIGLPLMSNEDHTYNVSKNDLDTVAKQLMNRNQHSRAQTVSNLHYLARVHRVGVSKALKAQRVCPRVRVCGQSVPRTVTIEG